MKTIKFFLAFFLLSLINSCDLLPEDPVLDLSNQIAYYWIMADADTYVECVKAGGACVPVEANYAGRPLVTAHNAHGVKRSYVDFPLPDFPSGTEVLEAYFEMFHSGTNEDGKSDDIFIDVTTIHTPWIVDQTHYSNQPVPVNAGAEFQIELESNAWSATSDIAFELSQEIKNPQDFHGFVAFIARNEPGYEKGYYSNDDRDIIVDGLGRAPRLLMKVELPEGVSVQDIDFVERHPDGNGRNVFGNRVSQTGSWPSEWELAAYAQ